MCLIFLKKLAADIQYLMVYADRYGRKLVFITSTVAFGITSLMCGLAQSASVLIAARFLQGLAGGAMFTCTIAIISHQYQDEHERGIAFTTWGIISGIGLGFGPIIGSTINAVSSWHWVFLIHVPLTFLALIPASIGIKESRDPHAKRLDGWGIVTLTIAVFGLTYVITQGADLGRATAIGLAAIAVASFAAFVLVERNTAQPMFDFSVSRIRKSTGASMGGHRRTKVLNSSHDSECGLRTPPEKKNLMLPKKQ